MWSTEERMETMGSLSLKFSREVEWLGIGGGRHEDL